MSYRMTLFVLLCTFSAFSSENTNQRLENVLKSSTLLKISCPKKDLIVSSVKPVGTEDWMTFSWFAKCRGEEWNCSGAETGTTCIKLKRKMSKKD